MHALQHYIYANIVISSFFKETKGFHPFFFCNKAWDFYISYKYISPIHPRKKFQGSDVTHKMLNLYYFGLFVIFSTKEGILPPRNIKLVIDIGVIVMFLLAHTLSCRNRGNSSVPPCTHSQLSIRASVFPSMGLFIYVLEVLFNNCMQFIQNHQQYKQNFQNGEYVFNFSRWEQCRQGVQILRVQILRGL
eukprot:TRINITY_DN7863_c0_g1_i6.p1 TRINITY_DN7863_c0_g1~~TRINITY_DN7863_c0_g1_i6.p1  ORF type:complete len:190 (-),score=-9.44 TRINITY_DN7863_c0_g1_i6:270-839(-)